MCYIAIMSKTITLREANQAFSRCVREVQGGEEFVITRDGKPVARLVPISGARILTMEQEAAFARADARMAEGWTLNASGLDRDAAHER